MESWLIETNSRVRGSAVNYDPIKLYNVVVPADFLYFNLCTGSSLLRSRTVLLRTEMSPEQSDSAVVEYIKTVTV